MSSVCSHCRNHIFSIYRFMYMLSKMNFESTKYRIIKFKANNTHTLIHVRVHCKNKWCNYHIPRSFQSHTLISIARGKKDPKPSKNKNSFSISIVVGWSDAVHPVRSILGFKKSLYPSHEMEFNFLFLNPINLFIYHGVSFNFILFISSYCLLYLFCIHLNERALHDSGV